MASRLREGVAPAYLLLCLILGGSAQGIWANMLLQLLGVLILASAALAPSEEPLLPPARQLLILAIAAVAVVAIQLVPLPSTVWPHLGGRAAIANGYRILGVPVPSMPLSLTPYNSLSDLLGLIPPLAMFCAIVRLKAYRIGWLATASAGGHSCRNFARSAPSVGQRLGAVALVLLRGKQFRRGDGFFRQRQSHGYFAGHNSAASRRHPRFG